MRLAIVGMALLCRFVAPASLGSAMAPDEQATILALLKSRDSAIKSLLKDGSGAYTGDQKNKLMRLINDIMDFSAMSETALGGQWNKLEESRRTDFVSAFSELVKRSSVKKLDIFRAVIEYRGIRVDGANVEVETRATYKRTRTGVSYTLHKQAGEWLVTDFSIDGVSTAESYRKSFGKIMRKHGFAGLMERLRRRLAEEGG